MIYLNKLLPLILSPLVVAMLLLCYGQLRGKRWAVWFAVCFLYLLSMPIASDAVLRFAEGYSERKDPQKLPNAEAIVVLSGMLEEVPTSFGAVTEWTDPDRFFAGVELFKLNKSNHLIFTGGLLPWQTQATPEGLVLKRFAEAMGVPAANIMVTGNVQNTIQEAEAIKGLLKQKAPSIILVTSAFHMPRSKQIFEHEGFRVIEHPVDFKVNVRETTPMDFLPSAYALQKSDLAIREQIGRLYYAVKFALAAKEP